VDGEEGSESEGEAAVKKGWEKVRPEWARNLAAQIVTIEASSARPLEERLSFPFTLLIEGDPPTRRKSGDEYRKARRCTERRRGEIVDQVKQRIPSEEIVRWLERDRLERPGIDGLVVTQIRDIEGFASALEFRPVGNAFAASWILGWLLLSFWRD
jgi:hypothetical protein